MMTMSEPLIKARMEKLLDGQEKTEVRMSFILVDDVKKWGRTSSLKETNN